MHGYKILCMPSLRSRFDWTWAAMHMAKRDMFPCARHICQAGRPTICVCNPNKQCGCSYRCVIDNTRVIDTAVVCRLKGAPGATGCGWSYGRLDNIASSPNATLGKAYSVVKHIYLAKLHEGYAAVLLPSWYLEL